MDFRILGPLEAHDENGVPIALSGRQPRIVLGLLLLHPNEVVSVDHRGAEEAEDDHTKSWIDGFVESRSKDKEQRWSWVEAAAAAWLNKREVEGKSEKALTAGESGPESADVAPPADESDQSEISSD